MEGIVIEADQLSEWLRTSFRDEDGTVYLPCAAFGNEQEALLCLGHDGVRMVMDEGHVYAPSEWLARERPQYAEAIRFMADRVRTAQVQPEAEQTIA